MAGSQVSLLMEMTFAETLQGIARLKVLLVIINFVTPLACSSPP